jgi:hypothetical protein
MNWYMTKVIDGQKRRIKAPVYKKYLPPIPWQWFEAAGSRAGMVLGMLVFRQFVMQHRQWPVAVTEALRKEGHFKRWGFNRTLRDLEAKGLVAVERSTHAAPRVTMLGWDDWLKDWAGGFNERKGLVSNRAAARQKMRW